jgi:hypothetical protein
MRHLLATRCSTEVRALAVLDPSMLLTVWPWETTAALAQTTTTTAPGPVVDLGGSQAVALVVVVGLAFALLWSVPVWLDARRAYRLRNRAVDLVGGQLLDAAKTNGLSVSELRELLGTIGEPATGQRGLARALMAFTIITVVGVALVALLLSSSGDASDLRKTVITSLLTLLGTIVGFYFGTRAAETASDATAPAPTRPASESTAAGSTSTPPAPPAEDGGAPVGEEAVTPVGEEGAGSVVEDEAAPVAEDDPEEQLEAGLGDLSPEEIVARNEQMVAEHGEPEEAAVEDEPLDEDELLPEDEPEDKDGGN